MARLFGTDGVRGLANKDITAELALDLSVAVAHELGGRGARPADQAASRSSQQAPWCAANTASWRRS